MSGYGTAQYGKATTEPGGSGNVEGFADGECSNHRPADACRCHSRASRLVCLFTLGWILVALAHASLVIAAGVQNEPNVPAVTEEATKTRTQLLNELNLRTAQVDLEHAKEAYERYEAEHKEAQVLFQKGIMSRKELDQAISAYAQAAQALKKAEIGLEKTKLGFLDNATHITILEAKKYYDNEGRRMLDLVLKNTSNLMQAESSLILAGPNLQAGPRPSPDQIRALLNIENIIVSIVNNAASIGKPYEEIIPVLPYGEQKKVTFELLTDVEQAGVKLQYLTQQVMDTVYLEKESLQEIPRIVASSFALEGQLGSAVSYPLDLEMLVTSQRNYSVAVTNLPPQIRCFFGEGGSRITQVHFSQEVSRHNVALSASIPAKLDAGMIDRRIDFQAWLTTPAQLDQVNKLRRQYEPNLIPERDLAALAAARVDLTLIPRGTGKLEILIDNLLQQIKPNQVVDFRADLRNDGTLPLFNVTPEVASQPLNWTARVDPNLIERLEPDEKRQVVIHLVPAAGAGVGEYQAEFNARGQTGSEVIEAVEKRLTVQISAETNVTAVAGLVIGLVVLITAIVFIGVRLSRR
jgi:hypothetical protein